MKKAILLFGIISLSLLLVGCAKTGASTAELNRDSNPAPDFELVNLETGEKITKDTLKGKPVLIHFFAAWCPRCKYTGSNVAQFDREANRDVFNVLMVNVDPQVTEAQMRSWKQTNGNSDWILAKYDQKILKDYNVQSLDTKYLLDSNGNIVHNDAILWDYNKASTFISRSFVS